MTLLRRRLPALLVVVALVAAVVFPFVQPPYRVFQGSMVGVFLVAILGLFLITGMAGQVTLGHSFFFAFGAFTSAFLMSTWEWADLATVPVAAVVTLAAGWLFGVPALRLRGLYLAIVTLSLAVAAPPLARRLEGFTGGVAGTTVAPAQPPAGLFADQWVYYEVLLVAVIALLIAFVLTRSPFGRAMRAVRDNEIAAAASGIDVAKVKIRAFALASMLAGTGGALYAITVRYVAPDSFTMLLSVMMLAALVVGGMRALFGAVLGAFFLQFVPVWAGQVNQALSGLVFGVLLILLLTFLPLGISGLFTGSWDRIRRRPTRRPPPPVEQAAVPEPASAGRPAP